MLHSVQVRLDGNDIAGQLNGMRGWLDRHGIEPDKFEIQRMDADGAVYRVDFRLLGEAAAFVDEFSGAVVG